jgi:hypothetical protein
LFSVDFNHKRRNIIMDEELRFQEKEKEIIELRDYL